MPASRPQAGDTATRGQVDFENFEPASICMAVWLKRAWEAKDEAGMTGNDSGKITINWDNASD